MSDRGSLFPQSIVRWRRSFRETAMDIRPIRTDEDPRAALAAIEACWGAPVGTEEGDKLDVLLALVDVYESRRWPIAIDESFDPS